LLNQDALHVTLIACNTLAVSFWEWLAQIQTKAMLWREVNQCRYELARIAFGAGQATARRTAGVNADQHKTDYRADVLTSFQMPAKRVPDIVVARLPLYLRALTAMQNSGKDFTSSQEMAAWLGISSAQIRKDLSHFGEFGKQGTGYSIAGLQEKLRQILNIEREWPIVIIGAGHIGRAVANYTGFAHRGFRVCAVFDSDPAKIGSSVGLQQVRDMAELSDFARGNKVRLAMIAVPANAAQDVADRVVAAGISAILNYAPINVNVPDHVRVENIDPVLHLQHMTYYLD
jgi:redox-sensing transcriptional repressor